MKEIPPTLSMHERDRRWRLVREFLRERGFNCLILAGLNGREQLDGYLTNDYNQGIVVFPLEGKPTYLVGSLSRITRHMELLKRGETTWMTDYRLGASGPGLVAILSEKGFDSVPIGVVGLESRTAAELQGCIPYKIWAYVLEHLPKATFVDVSHQFSERILIKSEEELALVRHGARIGEMACEAMLEVTRPGVSESKIYAAITKVIFENGAGLSYHALLLHSGVDNASQGPPTWMYQAQSPRIVQKGDVVQSEIFSRYGGLETQQQMSVALKPVHPVNLECAEVARRSYEVGLKSLAPGKKLKDVADAMDVPLREAGCWHLTSLIHTLGPLVTAVPSAERSEQLPGIQNYRSFRIPADPLPGKDLIIKSGMIFELEPAPCLRMHRISIGGTVIATEYGVEELNKLPTEMCLV